MGLLRAHLLGLALAAAAALASQSAPTLVGEWLTFDEDSGAPKSVIELYARGESYGGRVAEILTDNTDARCVECPGDRAGQPVLGLVIVRNLRAVRGKPGQWNGGAILDPEKGAEYKLSMWFEEGQPDRLYVRGRHWTGLYRTQVWTRKK